MTIQCKQYIYIFEFYIKRKLDITICFDEENNISENKSIIVVIFIEIGDQIKKSIWLFGTF